MSASAFHHQLLLIERNAARIALYLMHVSPLLLLILPAYILCCIKRGGHWFDEWMVPVLTFFLYPAGYLLVTVEDRYLYLTAFLLLLMGFRACDDMVGKTKLSPVFRWGSIAVLVASFCITPVRTLSALPRRDDVAEAAERLAATNALQGKLASCGGWRQIAGDRKSAASALLWRVGPGPDGRALAGLLNPEAESLAWPEETPERG